VARRDGATGTGGVFYYFSDHLKTASVITDAMGAIAAESDYYPWDGELQFVNNDSNDYKFTGKKRDIETGLDYFGARYYSNGLGRWISADWNAAPVPVPYADFHDPQSLNLYQFVGGNPASKADPDGHEIPTPEMDPGRLQTGYDIGAGGLKGLWNLAARTWNTGAAIVNAEYQTTYPGDSSQIPYLPEAEYSNTTQLVSGAVTQLGTVVYSAYKGITGNSGEIAPKEGSTTAGEDAGVKPASGEPPQLKAGKEAHAAEPVRPGEKAEVRTPSGKRMDRYDEGRAHIREIKRDNPRGRKAGEKQLRGYKKEMDHATGRNHTTELTLYKPKQQ
jgi:RHS repeat-associated protein